MATSGELGFGCVSDHTLVRRAPQSVDRPSRLAVARRTEPCARGQIRAAATETVLANEYVQQSQVSGNSVSVPRRERGEANLCAPTVQDGIEVDSRHASE